VKGLVSAHWKIGSLRDCKNRMLLEHPTTREAEEERYQNRKLSEKKRGQKIEYERDPKTTSTRGI